jgi:hypothetical protein
MKFHSNMFGWDYVWRDFADSKGGEVVSDTTKENNPILHVFIPVEGSEASIRLTPFSIKGKSKGSGTSASLHYSPKEHFSFYIRTEKGVDQIGKAFGLQDIILGDPDFDKQFLIQGTDEGKVRNLFADMHLRDVILQNGLSELRLVTDGAQLPAGHKLPTGRHAIVYSTEKVLDKFEQLEAIYSILTQVVHRIGAIPALVGEEEVFSVEEEQEEEKSQGNRLHSPLLDMA